MTDLHTLPRDLPRPIDDGVCDHLVGLAIPRIGLRSTQDRFIDVGAPYDGHTVLYCYPRTGIPGETLPDGWDAIPGARGCTPEACSFRDHAAEMAMLGARLFGLSTQDTRHQREMAERLQLPFEVLSDAECAFTDALRLPTFEFDGVRLLKRLTFVVREGLIEHVFYPVFPPDTHAKDVAQWLARNP